MSRLITSGCEIGLETNDVRLGTDGDRENIGGVNPARDTSVFRSGAAAYKFDAGAAGESFIEWNTPGTGATTNRHYFVRGYFRFPDTTPTSEFNLLTGSLSGSTVVAVRLKTDGTLTLSRRVNTAANIGTPSSALVADTWHRIELRWMVATGGGANSSCELYLDGVLVSTVTGQNFNSTALNRFEAGATTTPGGSNFLIYLDDVALNDDQGSDQNSYPGEGKVVLLKPISDSQVGSWTGGSGGTSNLFDAVDNTPPVGTASESNTTQIESVDTSGDNGTDEYRASLTTYTSAGIGAEDTITLLHPILWHGTDAAVAGVTGSYGGVSNPSWTYDTFSYGDGLSAAVGTWDVNWRPKHGTIQYAPSVTLGTSPVIGLRKTDATAGVASACFMGVYVEFVPASFPATGLLDDFTGADETPITTNWSSPLFSGENGLRRISNALVGSIVGGATFSNSYYDLASYGPDAEVWATLTTLDTTVDDHVTLYLPMTNAGASALDGYAVRMITQAGADVVYLLRYDDGSPTQLGSSIATEIFVDGDGLGARRIGNDLFAYRRSGGVWSLIGMRTDATYSHSGRIGVQLFAASVPSTFVIDDFGGGDYGEEEEALPGYQRISGPAQLTASAATLYTVPDGCRLELRSVDLNNPSGSLRKVTLSVGSDAAATRVLELLDIDAGASLNLRRGINHTLEAGEVLQGYADSAGVVVATIDGWLDEL